MRSAVPQINDAQFRELAKGENEAVERYYLSKASAITLADDKRNNILKQSTTIVADYEREFEELSDERRVMECDFKRLQSRIMQSSGDTRRRLQRLSGLRKFSAQP